MALPRTRMFGLCLCLMATGSCRTKHRHAPDHSAAFLPLPHRILYAAEFLICLFGVTIAIAPITLTYSLLSKRRLYAVPLSISIAKTIWYCKMSKKRIRLSRLDIEHRGCMKLADFACLASTQGSFWLLFRLGSSSHIGCNLSRTWQRQPDERSGRKM